MSVKPKPDGYQSVIPYLMSADAVRQIEFIVKAFGATELHRMTMPSGMVMHSSLQVGDSKVMVSQACSQMGPSSATLYVYVDDVDATYQQALSAGGASVSEPRNEFYGDRMCGVKDPAGNHWFIATQVEVVSPEEMARRQEELMKEWTAA